VPLPEIISI